MWVAFVFHDNVAYVPGWFLCIVFGVVMGRQFRSSQGSR